MMATLKPSTSPIRILNWWVSLLAATLYGGNPDRKHRLWNIVSTERYIHHMQVLLKWCYIELDRSQCENLNHLYCRTVSLSFYWEVPAWSMRHTNKGKSPKIPIGILIVCRKVRPPNKTDMLSTNNSNNLIMYVSEILLLESVVVCSCKNKTSSLP
jgi:hypothetical protein